MPRTASAPLLLALALAVLSAAGGALAATDCGPYGQAKDGNCIYLPGGGSARGLDTQVMEIRQSGSFSGSFGSVTVHPGANATLAGSADAVTIRRGAALVLSGNARAVTVEGRAELSGNLGRVYVAEGATARISGVAAEVTGPGRAEVTPGSVIGGRVIPGQDPQGRDGMPRRPAS